MAEHDDPHIVITKPGVLAFGEGLPVGTDITTFFQDETVVHLSCGEDHSAVVCESGRVYTFGKNQDNGWMANDVDTVAGPMLVAALSKVKIIQAACGRQYTVFLTDKGELYSCGLNEEGQLGLGHKDKVPTPVRVTGLPPIKQVAARYCHTMVVTNNGDVWGAGYNLHGELGLGHVNNQNSFTKVPNLPEPIIDISCGSHHTALISASRVLLMTGWNKYGQLGLSEGSSLSSFKPVSLPTTSVAAVSCGYYHTVALRVDGTTWAWGSNNDGRLGTGNSDNRTTPTKMVGLKDQTISRVITGCYQTAVLTQEGDVFTCGLGTSGQLGLGMENLSTPTLLPKSPGLVVQQVALSNTYSLLLVVPKSDAKAASQPQIGINTEDVDAKTENLITDLERNIMKSLECPVCFKIMCPPIHLCINGHSLCGSCRSDAHTTVCPVCREQFMVGRNITLESLSANIQLPCTDCLRRLPVCELEGHGDVCPRRKYSCPVQRKSCGWSGRPDAMLAHTSSAHPDQTWGDLPHLFAHSLSNGLVHTDLLAAHNEVFTLQRRYDEAANKFQAALRYIGPPQNAHKFKFKLTYFMADHNNSTYRRGVCSDIESVEDMLRSSNCVSIKTHVLDSFRQKGCLVCRVDILKVGRSELDDQIEALLNNVNA